jgi:hypothetical protein
VHASKREVDVLLKGVGEKSVENEVKHVLEMVLSCFLSLDPYKFHSRLSQAWNFFFYMEV